MQHANEPIKLCSISDISLSGGTEHTFRVPLRFRCLCHDSSGPENGFSVNVLMDSEHACSKARLCACVISGANFFVCGRRKVMTRPLRGLGNLAAGHGFGPFEVSVPQHLSLTKSRQSADHITCTVIGSSHNLANMTHTEHHRRFHLRCAN